MKSKPRHLPRLILSLFLISILLAACGGGSRADETITVSGAFALYPLMTQWAETYEQLNPGVRIDVTAGGAGKGISDTLAGAVDIGMVSREITPEELERGVFPIAVARDAVFGTINTANPHFDRIMQKGFTPKILAGIYITGEITTWGQALGIPAITDQIRVFTRADSAGAAEMWALYIAGKKQSDLLGIGVNSDPGILEVVVKDPLGIGYNNLNYLFDMETNKPIAGIAILPLDLNASGAIEADEIFSDRSAAMQAVADGRYPTPPARDLYVITRGAPSGAVREFIHWMLNEGQAYVSPNGYVQLNADKLEEVRAILDGQE
ncbi:MAG: substrate-binding domain-containing protein [Chloroflexota bacterium]|jgi:phosphate transport system substrate-binding protein